MIAYKVVSQEKGKLISAIVRGRKRVYKVGIPTKGDALFAFKSLESAQKFIIEIKRSWNYSYPVIYKSEVKLGGNRPERMRIKYDGKFTRRECDYWEGHGDYENILFCSEITLLKVVA